MRGIVKGFVVGTLGLAVLFGSPGVSLAVKKKLSGRNWCDPGIPAPQLPPGKFCTGGREPTPLNGETGCEVWCCQDNPGCETMSCQPPGGVGALRNGLPRTGGMMQIEPPAPVPLGGLRKLPVAPGQLQIK